jgi:hypothetical protein
MTGAQTLAGLFRVPPEQFTVARNRLVAELRRAGEEAVAASVAKLPRPTPVVWAINQVASQHGAAVERLLDAADRLKRAQLGPASADVPLSAKAYREAVATLVEQTLAQLKGAGRPTTAAIRTRLTGTLMAAATDPELRESLRAGRLSREHAITGFDVFAAASRPALRVVKSAGGSPAPPPVDRDAMRRRAEARLRLETARAELARMESRIQELENAAGEAARSAAEAHQRAAAARRAVAQGHADLKAAQAKLQAIERAARDP